MGDSRIVPNRLPEAGAWVAHSEPSRESRSHEHLGTKVEPQTQGRVCGISRHVEGAAMSGPHWQTVTQTTLGRDPGKVGPRLLASGDGDGSTADSPPEVPPGIVL